MKKLLNIIKSFMRERFFLPILEVSSMSEICFSIIKTALH